MTACHGVAAQISPIPPIPPIRALIADDHPLILLAMENLLSGFPNMEIVGRASDSNELFAEAERVACDLVVMDLHMPGGAHGDGIEAVGRFRARFPQLALVVLTMECEADALQKTVAFGANAVISKRDRIDLIHVAIVTALARESYLGPAVRTQLADASRERRLDQVRQLLSRREMEVFTHYAAGLGVTEIAAQLGRSVKTISAQKCTAMKKLALHSDVELFRFAVDHGVVTDALSQNMR
ncbi:response regulator transcription factor [Paraburkholderia sp. BL10I2N1]|uniref:response regulator transcription factor n=1 Tax=Paraburkholderia sp. BL10I2N1 TaxID=1938796 RepID=UPI00105F6DBF|nr:response regulator transcription factor [Paraburkholderia sp. BL10I2N1]TDN68455.1 LuxR family two component transcriptional regulator [Paraburkholderia sp. BL10I2N1]